MDFTQAQSLLRAEIASDTPVGKALQVLLAGAEVDAYRLSSKILDQAHLQRLTGRAEGIHHVSTLIAPVKTAAQRGPQTSPAAGVTL